MIPALLFIRLVCVWLLLLWFHLLFLLCPDALLMRHRFSWIRASDFEKGEMLLLVALQL